MFGTWSSMVAAEWDHYYSFALMVSPTRRVVGAVIRGLNVRFPPNLSH